MGLGTPYIVSMLLERACMRSMSVHACWRHTGWRHLSPDGYYHVHAALQQGVFNAMHSTKERVVQFNILNPTLGAFSVLIASVWAQWACRSSAYRHGLLAEHPHQP
jgi:hypothetical protein